MDPVLLKVLEPDEKLYEAAQAATEGFFDVFRTTRVEPPARKKRKVEESPASVMDLA